MTDAVVSYEGVSEDDFDFQSRGMTMRITGMDRYGRKRKAYVPAFLRTDLTDIRDVDSREAGSVISDADDFRLEFSTCQILDAKSDGKFFTAFGAEEIAVEIEILGEFLRVKLVRVRNQEIFGM